jgi:predicted nucleotidyltransferase component of viral defense system
MDNNKHKMYLIQILTDIYSDRELSVALGFKGGTAAMLFYGLPRFSVDLDFNLLYSTVAEKTFAGLYRQKGKFAQTQFALQAWRIGCRRHEIVCPQQTATGNGVFVEILSNVSLVEKKLTPIFFRLQSV